MKLPHRFFPLPGEWGQLGMGAAGGLRVIGGGGRTTRGEVGLLEERED